MLKYANEDVLKSLLPVVDNFERGFTTIEETDKDDAFVQGMQQVYKQMMTELESMGVKPIEAVGTRFDPEFHEAVSHIEDPEKGEQEIVQEYRKGYKIGNKVVRHSMVIVAN